MTPTKDDKLGTWLNYMGSIHTSAIDMGLSRVLPVFECLNIQKNAYVFMAAGTNGKGSTTATIAQICQKAGLKTALYQSPHLVSFNERISIDGVQVDDDTLVNAFVQVEEARVACGLSLSFFEMTTLAGLLIFSQSACDVWVLEVGLGGRLDVVNVVEPDMCVITNVAIDHVDWLGDTREKIGFEKAGILRQGGTLIYGERDMPTSVRQAIETLGVTCYQYGKDYLAQETVEGWTYSGSACTLNLPKPCLSLVNVSTAITAVLASSLMVDELTIASAMQAVRLAGRFDRRQIAGREWLFDVAHNEAGVRFLLTQFVPLWADFYQHHPTTKLHLLFSMLADKDVEAVLAIIADSGLPIATWHTATLDNPRAMQGQDLQIKIKKYSDAPCVVYETMTQATNGVLEATKEGDFVLVFGSFHTIGESLVALGQYQGFEAIK